MSNIASAFDHGKAFIAFLTCGDPDLETTAAAVRAAVRGGADLIELGIPFSDPTAEGPVIQEANLRALTAGTTTDKIFDLVSELRKDVTVPMVFMTYANVVFSYGAERFLDNCRRTGIDGLILPDLPYEEKDEFLPACRERDIALISLIAPTSEQRIAMILTMAEPTMAPSERSAMARACAGVEIPKPIAKGTCAFSRMARVTAERSVVISLRVPVTPREETR